LIRRILILASVAASVAFAQTDIGGGLNAGTGGGGSTLPSYVVTTINPSSQNLIGPLCAPQFGQTFYGFCFPAGTNAGVWAGATQYGMGALVTFSGADYINILSTNTGITPGTNAAAWYKVMGSTGVGFVPTNIDVAFAAARSWTTINGFNDMLILPQGTSHTCMGLAQIGPNLTSIEGADRTHDGTRLLTDCTPQMINPFYGVAAATVYVGPPVSGPIPQGFSLNWVHISGNGADHANHALACGEFYGLLRPNFEGDDCTGIQPPGIETDHMWEWGFNSAAANVANMRNVHTSASSTGAPSTYCNLALTVGGGSVLTGITSASGFPCGAGYTPSTTVPVIWTGASVAAGIKCCLTFPVAHGTTNSSGQVISLTLDSPGVGVDPTITGIVTNPPSSRYLMKFTNISDSTVEQAEPVGLTDQTGANIYVDGGGLNWFIRPHPYGGCITGILDNAGTHFLGVEDDSCAWYGLQFQGLAGSVNGFVAFWDHATFTNVGTPAFSQQMTTQLPGSNLIFIGPAAYGTTIQGVTCIDQNNSGGGTAFVDSFGPDFVLANTAGFPGAVSAINNQGISSIAPTTGQPGFGANIHGCYASGNHAQVNYFTGLMTIHTQNQGINLIGDSANTNIQISNTTAGAHAYQLVNEGATTSLGFFDAGTGANNTPFAISGTLKAFQIVGGGTLAFNNNTSNAFQGTTQAQITSPGSNQISFDGSTAGNALARLTFQQAIIGNATNGQGLIDMWNSTTAAGAPGTSGLDRLYFKNDQLCSKNNSNAEICYTASGSGGVTWPAVNTVLLSTGTTTPPSGLAVVNGDCIVGSGGVATFAPCAGGIGFPPAGIPVSTGSAWGTSFGAQGTDTNLMTSGTISGGAGTNVCLDAIAGLTTVGCPTGAATTAAAVSYTDPTTTTVSTVQAVIDQLPTIIQMGAQGNAFNFSPCSVTSGTNTVTCTGASFSGGNVGQVIWISTTAGNWQSTIASVTSSTVIVTSTNSPATFSGVTATFGSAADQTAFAAAAASHLNFNVPSGRYLITAPVHFIKQTLFGHGNDTQINCTMSSGICLQWDYLSGSGSAFQPGLRDARVMGPGFNGTSTTGIQSGGTNGAAGMLLSHVEVTNFPVALNLATGTLDFQGEHSYFFNNTKNLYDSGASESVIFFHSFFVAGGVDRGVTDKSNCIDIESGIFKLNFVGGSIVECAVNVNASALINFYGVHEEDVNNTVQPYLVNAGGAISFNGDVILGNGTTGGPPYWANETSGSITTEDETTFSTALLTSPSLVNGSGNSMVNIGFMPNWDVNGFPRGGAITGSFSKSFIKPQEAVTGSVSTPFTVPNTQDFTLCNGSGATINLPDEPYTNEEVLVANINGTNSCTVNGNSGVTTNIRNGTSTVTNLTIAAGGTMGFRWLAQTSYWVVFANSAAGGGGGSGNATQFQGVPISATGPTNGQFFSYDSGATQYNLTSITPVVNGFGTTATGTSNLQINVSKSVRTVTTTSDAVLNTDWGNLVTYNNAGAVAVSLSQAGVGGNFIAGWNTTLRNYGAGTVTVTAGGGSNIGPTTNVYAIASGHFCEIISNGTFYDLGACN
jgi:hypothetical protein